MPANGIKPGLNPLEVIVMKKPFYKQPRLANCSQRQKLLQYITKQKFGAGLPMCKGC